MLLLLLVSANAFFNGVVMIYCADNSVRAQDETGNRAAPELGFAVIIMFCEPPCVRIVATVDSAYTVIKSHELQTVSDDCEDCHKDRICEDG